MVGEVRQEWAQVLLQFVGNVEERGETIGHVPNLAVLGEDHREDGREFRRMGAEVIGLLPNACHVAQEPQREAGVAGALVFEEHIEKGLAPEEAGGEEQVGVGAAEL